MEHLMMQQQSKLQTKENGFINECREEVQKSKNLIEGIHVDEIRVDKEDIKAFEVEAIANLVENFIQLDYTGEPITYRSMPLNFIWVESFDSDPKSFVDYNCPSSEE
jgi:hypothetical protein